MSQKSARFENNYTGRSGDAWGITVSNSGRLLADMMVMIKYLITQKS